jgi:hypothetical protein
MPRKVFVPEPLYHLALNLGALLAVVSATWWCGVNVHHHLDRYLAAKDVRSALGEQAAADGYLRTALIYAAAWFGTVMACLLVKLLVDIAYDVRSLRIQGEQRDDYAGAQK